MPDCEVRGLDAGWGLMDYFADCGCVKGVAVDVMLLIALDPEQDPEAGERAARVLRAEIADLGGVERRPVVGLRAAGPAV